MIQILVFIYWLFLDTLHGGFLDECGQEWLQHSTSGAYQSGGSSGHEKWKRPGVQNSKPVSAAQQVCEQLHEQTTWDPVSTPHCPEQKQFKKESVTVNEWAHWMETKDKNRIIMALLIVLTHTLTLGLQSARQALQWEPLAPGHPVLCSSLGLSRLRVLSILKVH